MIRCGTTMRTAVAAAFLPLLTVCVLAQEAAPAGGQGGGGRGGRRFDPEQFRARRLARYKEAIGVSDEEWAKLKPAVEKVQKLSDETQGNARMLMRRARRRGGQAAEADATREKTAFETSSDALRAALADPAATPEQIEAKLAALCAVTAKSEADLAKARTELAALLTLRQKAQLVLMGLLE